LCPEREISLRVLWSKIKPQTCKLYIIEKISFGGSGPINILTEPYLAKCLMFSLWKRIKEVIRFQSLLLRLNIQALPPGFPHGASVKREMLHFQTFHDMAYVTFRTPSKEAFPPGSTRRTTIERDAPFPEPSFVRLSKSPVNDPPPNVVLMDRVARFQSLLLVISRSLLYKGLLIKQNFTFLSKVPPLHGLPAGPLWREMFLLQSHWFIHPFVPLSVPI
jgi:hypothetical protein